MVESFWNSSKRKAGKQNLMIWKPKEVTCDIWKSPRQLMFQMKADIPKSGFPSGSMVKKILVIAGDMGSIPGSGK